MINPYLSISIFRWCGPGIDIRLKDCQQVYKKHQNFQKAEPQLAAISNQGLEAGAGSGRISTNLSTALVPYRPYVAAST